ncbi:MAG: TlyA family RNA methyltransferase [Hyphomicrobiales bacterium]|nr:TlyA family RNA methyltransferase [Hyphomicrobiales bacterium]MDE2018487.1 TlyA family RNA methyltransferase [Hyphomicrobiales bacterium]
MTGQPKSGRADLALVARGLFDSRAKAQAAIEAGGVTCDGRPVTRASQPIAEGARVEARPAHPWVSRGGVKLAAALDAFGLDPAGAIALDVGASTGGFTQVLLARGAARVHAIDVGRGQLHPDLAADARVVAREATDARALTATDFPASPDFATFDVSFISLALVLPHALALMAPRAAAVALVKPQFEAGRAALDKGLVRDPAAREAAAAKVEALFDGLGWRRVGRIASPIAGGDGNLEWLVGARRG